MIRDHKVWKPFNHHYPASYFPIYPIFHPFFTISESPIPIYSSLLAICSICLGLKRTKTSKNVLSVRNRWNWPKSRKVRYETLWKSDILSHFWNFRTLIRTLNLNLANSKYIWNILNRNNRHVRLIKMFILFHFMFYLLWFPSKF